MTPEQVCDVLQVKKDWLYDHVQSGDLPYLRLTDRGSLRFRESDVEAYIQSRMSA